MFTVVVSSAKMPGSCWGKYKHVAVVWHEPSFRPTRIDDRPHAVREIVRQWRRQHDGKTSRCAASVAEAKARELAQRLNAIEALAEYLGRYR